jgi:hypothetical protein
MILEERYLHAYVHINKSRTQLSRRAHILFIICNSLLINYINTHRSIAPIPCVITVDIYDLSAVPAPGPWLKVVLLTCDMKCGKGAGPKSLPHFSSRWPKTWPEKAAKCTNVLAEIKGESSARAAYVGILNIFWGSKYRDLACQTSSMAQPEY